jgi:hypothetical protein
VAAILGSISALFRIVYMLVGIAAFYMIYYAVRTDEGRTLAKVSEIFRESYLRQMLFNIIPASFDFYSNSYISFFSTLSVPEVLFRHVQRL